MSTYISHIYTWCIYCTKSCDVSFTGACGQDIGNVVGVIAVVIIWRVLYNSSSPFFFEGSISPKRSSGYVWVKGFVQIKGHTLFHGKLHMQIDLIQNCLHFLNIFLIHLRHWSELCVLSVTMSLYKSRTVCFHLLYPPQTKLRGYIVNRSLCPFVHSFVRSFLRPSVHPSLPPYL